MSSQVTAADFFTGADRIAVAHQGRPVVSIEPVLDGRKYYRLRFEFGDTVLVAATQLLQCEALLDDLYHTDNTLLMHKAHFKYEDGVIFVNGVMIKNTITAPNGFIELQLAHGTPVRITDRTYYRMLHE